jgi:hypothetical protein
MSTESDALLQLETTWKEWIEHESFLERRKAAAKSRPSAVIPVYDELVFKCLVRDMFLYGHHAADWRMQSASARSQINEATNRNSTEFR